MVRLASACFVMFLAACGGGGGGGSVRTPDVPVMAPGDTFANRVVADGVALRLRRAANSLRMSRSPEGVGVVTQTSYSFASVPRLSFRIVPEFDDNGVLNFRGLRYVEDQDGSHVATWVLRTTDEEEVERFDVEAGDLHGIPGWRGVEHGSIGGIGETSVRIWNVYTNIENEVDPDWLALGWWLQGGLRDDGGFSGNLGYTVTGNDPFQGDAIDALSGTATYEGAAVGLYMQKAGADANPVFDTFAAKANLTVDFGDAAVGGQIQGSISEGMTENAVEVPTITLEPASIVQATTGTWLGGSIRGETTGNGFSGQWGAKFFGNGDVHPGSVAGTFGARSADDLQAVLGGFAAFKQ